MMYNSNPLLHVIYKEINNYLVQALLIMFSSNPKLNFSTEGDSIDFSLV